MRRPFSGMLLLAAVMLTQACNNTQLPAGPTLPTIPVITESFEGTLTINGGATHPFVVGTPGAVTATLSELPTADDESVLIGMSLGTWNTTTESCQIIIAKDNAVQGSIILGTAQTSGAFCVRVYDVGKLKAPAPYLISVSHQ